MQGDVLTTRNDFSVADKTPSQIHYPEMIPMIRKLSI
jgi:hypothetical protein